MGEQAERYIVKGSDTFYQSIGEGAAIPFAATQFDAFDKAMGVAKGTRGTVYKLEAKPVPGPKKQTYPLLWVLLFGILIVPLWQQIKAGEQVPFLTSEPRDLVCPIARTRC